MPQAYLHDIPFDTFIKYYLNNENDADAISVNARYQPVYKEYTVGTYYKYKYAYTKPSGELVECCIKTIKPLPLDIGAIGKKIYTVDSDLTLTSPRLATAGTNIVKKVDRRSKNIKILHTDPEDTTGGDIFERILKLPQNEPIFSTPTSNFCISADPEVPVYYIPIQDAVSDFFDNLSLYDYYGKIKDHIYYAMFSRIEDNVRKFYVRISEPDNENNDQEGVNYKSIESMETGIKVITETEYQDPDYDNIYYYSVINTKTKREVGKIYQLEPHNVLDYNEQGKAHFVDTYKKEGMLNYDLYFSEDDMPISPIMKYHLYMREYKSIVGSPDMDPTVDFTKYSKTNTLFYKDFTDHGEIGYAYKYTETITSPIILTKAIKQDPIYVQVAIPIATPKPVSTTIKDIRPITAKVTEAAKTAVTQISNLAEKLILSTTLSTNIKTPVATAKTTTITANGAKKLTKTLTVTPRRGAKAAKAVLSSTTKKTSGITKVDLANSLNSTSSLLTNAIKNNIDDIRYKAIDKVSATSKKDIISVGKQLTEALEKQVVFKTIKQERPDIIVTLKEVVKNMSKGSVTKKFFDTREIYNVNILSTATVELNKGLAVTAEAKAITERDHALQKIIIEAISGNSETIKGSVSSYETLVDTEHLSPAPADGDIYKLTEQSTYAGVTYAKNSLFKYNLVDGVQSWTKYMPYTYSMPASGYKDVTNLQHNVITSISEILSKTKFYMYRNNIYVLTLDKPNKKVRVRTIYKYIIDRINEMNVCGDNRNGEVTVESCDPNADTRKTVVTDFRITNNNLVTELQKHIKDVNDFDDNDCISKIKKIFNTASSYEKASVHSQDRVSENILLDKYKTGFRNVTVNAMVSKDSNIYSSSAVTDKFDMYVYVMSLYDNLVKSLTVLPIKNKGGVCYDHKNDTTYYGFMNYDSDLVTFNYIRAKSSEAYTPDYKINTNDTLTQDEQIALMHDIENSNYIKRLLNYKQYNLNAEEFNHRYSDELYHRNYKNITESQNVYESFDTSYLQGKTYSEQEFAISDILDKSITLYTEYLFANNNKNNKDTEDIDSPTSFNRRSLNLYLDKINNCRNIFMLDNDGQYQLKHVFKNTDEDVDLFIESLKQKIDRGE